MQTKLNQKSMYRYMWCSCHADASGGATVEANHVVCPSALTVVRSACQNNMADSIRATLTL